MVNDEMLRQLVLDRRQEREREAAEWRLAAPARSEGHRRSGARAPAAELGYLLAARREATR